MAEVVKAEVADACPADRRLPRGLDPVDRTVLEGEYQAFWFFVGKLRKEFGESRGERDLAGLPACGFRVSDEEHATGEIDVLHALRKKFSPAHSRIERGKDDLKVRRGRTE